MSQRSRSSAAIYKAAFLAVMFLILPAGRLTAGRAFEARRFAEHLRDGRARITIPDVPLVNGEKGSLELEEFKVWAPDAKVVVDDGSGKQREIAPPDRRYFKGRVMGEDNSLVFISVDAKKPHDLEGIVMVKDKKLAIGRGRPARGDDRRPHEAEKGPILIAEIDEVDELLDQTSSWTCQIEKTRLSKDKVNHPAEVERFVAKSHAGETTNDSYSLRLAIETDGELYAALGSESAVTTYLGNLVGAASTIYQRDLATTLTISHTHVYSDSSTDPWTFTSADGGLAQMSTVWHNATYHPNFSSDSTLFRSAVVMVSGKLLSSGIAWVDNLCRAASSDFFCGADGSNCGSSAYANAYAGAYAFNGSSGSVSTTVPDPNAIVSGVQYGLPTGSTFWMLLEFVHELGHVVGADHSQCVSITAEEKTTYGIGTTYPDRNFVDECFNLDGSGCFSSSSSGGQACSGGYCPGGVPNEKGTIMSYCHNIFSGGIRQSRYLFGKSGEVSSKMLTLIKAELDVLSILPASQRPNGTMTIGSAPIACSAGQTASVASCTNCTYSWQITGGTITSSTTSNSITYTPTGTSVTVTVTITSQQGCAITNSATVTTSCSSLAAPTGVVATAMSGTSVGISWDAVSGASSYEVHRSSNGTTFTQIASCNVPTTSCTDSTASANTAYLYKVRAGSTGTFSANELATTVIFTNDPLVAGTTPVQALHVTELRTAVDAVRALANSGVANPFSYTDTTITAGTAQVRRIHIIDLRTALDAARATLALGALSYTDPTVTIGSTQVKAAHFTELRNGAK